LPSGPFTNKPEDADPANLLPSFLKYPKLSVPRGEVGNTWVGVGVPLVDGVSTVSSAASEEGKEDWAGVGDEDGGEKKGEPRGTPGLIGDVAMGEK
jgi:hypothetical protein